MKRGFSLIETTFSLGLFALLMVVTYLATQHSVSVWRNVSGADQASRGLRRAEANLLRDLTPACLQKLSTTPVPASLAGGGRDGDAVWFLSANGQRKSDGSPFWQRNVLYYLIAPQGDTCPGGLGPDGYDDRCPHKVLIRKVIDSSPVTVATDEATEEQLLSDVSAYLDAPDGLDTSYMSGPGLESVGVVASHLLWFRVVPGAGEVALDLRAIAEEEARRTLTVGSTPLATGRFTTQHTLSIFPRSGP